MESNTAQVVIETIQDIEKGSINEPNRKCSTMSGSSLKKNVETIKKMQRTILLFLIIIILSSDLLIQILNRRSE